MISTSVRTRVVTPARSGEADVLVAAQPWVTDQAALGGEMVRRVINEFDIAWSSTRADLGVITTESTWAWEIKSGVDNLNRLKNQGVTYGAVADFCGLIMDERWVGLAESMVPDYWAIVVASGPPSDQTLEQVRPPTPSPAIDPAKVAKYLWAAEARQVLGVLRGVKVTKLSRAEAINRIVQLTHDQVPLLQAIVREHLAHKPPDLATPGPRARPVHWATIRHLVEAHHHRPASP